METLNAQQYAADLVDKVGQEAAEARINAEMENLTKDGSASSNLNQISFFLKVLRYIKK